jgi:hypothetical protein
MSLKKKFLSGVAVALTLPCVTIAAPISFEEIVFAGPQLDAHFVTEAGSALPVGIATVTGDNELQQRNFVPGTTNLEAGEATVLGIGVTAIDHASGAFVVRNFDNTPRAINLDGSIPTVDPDLEVFSAGDDGSLGGIFFGTAPGIQPPNSMNAEFYLAPGTSAFGNVFDIAGVFEYGLNSDGQLFRRDALTGLLVLGPNIAQGNNRISGSGDCVVSGNTFWNVGTGAVTRLGSITGSQCYDGFGFFGSEAGTAYSFDLAGNELNEFDLSGTSLFDSIYDPLNNQAGFLSSNSVELQWADNPFEPFDTGNISAVPLPATFWLLALGIVGLLRYPRRA